jgi:hypothetical protein
MLLHDDTFSVVWTNNTIRSFTWYFYMNGPMRLYQYFMNIIDCIMLINGLAFLADTNGDNHRTCLNDNVDQVRHWG